MDTQGNRVFWTASVPNSDVTVNFGAGTAELSVSNLAAEDYFNLPNASIPGNEVDATVSFDVVWSGPVSRRVNVKDAANGFAGDYVEENVGNAVTINWSASNSQGFSFTANPGNLSTSVAEAGPFAELGHERNGTFFPGGSSPSRPNRPLVQALVDQSFAALAPPNTGAASPPVSTGSALGNSGSQSAEQPPSAANPSSAGTAAATVQAARDRVFELGSGADLTSVPPDLGQPESDTLFW